MKKLHKTLTAVISLSLILAYLFSFTAHAEGFTVFASQASGYNGETVTIDVKITGGSLGSYSVFVNFDKSVLQYVSCSLGSAGAVLKYASCQYNDSLSQVSYNGLTDENINTYVSGTVMSVTFLIIGKAENTAKATPIGISAGAYNSDSSRIGVSSEGSSVMIFPSGSSGTTQGSVAVLPDESTTVASDIPKSSDATLKSLKVCGITDAGALTVENTLSPVFASGTLFYNSSVMGDVSKLQIEAVPTSETAKVTIPAAYLKMDIGSNKTRITVTAEDGTQNVYVLTTVKSDSGTSILATVTTEEYTQGLSDEITTEVVPETETTPNVFVTAVVPTAAVTEISRNDTFIIIGATSGVAALLALGFSFSFFAKIGKKKKEDKTT